ncbi:hypothetical protein ACPV36_05480 [Photobacterium damselae]|uniref:hypothetical protein n=1 Tax=Photobacterium damselae TaxID=38293 RepID=UPI00406960F0
MEDHSFVITERYKFILDKIKFLDSQYHQNLLLNIKILILLFGFVSAAIVAVNESKIEISTLIFSIKTAGIIILFSSIYFFLNTIVIMISWFDYRYEEVELLNKIGCDINRTLPKMTSIYRWSEFYYILFLIVLFVFSIYVFLNPQIFIFKL